MKKKIISFVLLFIIFTLGVYGYAALFPKKVSTKAPIKETPGVNTLPYTKIEPNFYASLIGQSFQEVEKDLGQPEKMVTLTNETTYYDYGRNYQDYLKIIFTKGQVSEIFSLGEKRNNQPFYLNMDTSELSKLIPLSATFNLEEVMGEPFSFELTEEDLNYRPLVAFSNHSFGIMYFDPTEGGLLGICYLSSNALKEKMPYEILAGDFYQPEETPVLSLEEKNELFAETYKETLDILRQQVSLPSFGNLFVNDALVKNALGDFLQNKDKILTSEELRNFNASQVLINVPFKLKGERLKEVMTGFNLEKINTGLLKTPVTSPIQEAMDEFVLGSLKEYYHQENSLTLSVAFEDEVMVVLLSDTKLAQSSTDSGE